MEPSNWLHRLKELGPRATSGAMRAMGIGSGVLRQVIGGLSIFGSNESSSMYEDQQFDEKHYFLIPDRRNATYYSLYVLRCLPEGIPPINDLPKHRLFHLPSDACLPTLELMMLEAARDQAANVDVPQNSIATRLSDLADNIDRLDHRVFQGSLLIGGLVALINPVAGAALAAKSLIPSVSLILSKHGLKYAGDLANSIDVARRVKVAEKDVLRQFRGAGTEMIVNPLLCQLDRALATTEFEYDPMLDFADGRWAQRERDRVRLQTLTCQAICNTYDEVLRDESLWREAGLGPEDIRFLKLLRSIANE